MTNQEQIEEMACDICMVIRCCNAPYSPVPSCAAYQHAKIAFEKGYLKQSEGEWLEQVRVSKEGKPLLRHYKCNLCGVYLATKANFCPNCGAKMKGGAK